MSRQELVSAFLEGRVSRRTLIRRLIAGGVSTGAAISYAQLLDPQRAGAATPASAHNDHYPMVDMKIVTPNLATARNQAKIKVNVTCTEELGAVFFEVFHKRAGGGVRIGSRFIPPNFLTGAGSKDAVIDVVTNTFASRSSARFYVHARSHDAEGYPALATTAKTLR